MIDADDAVTFRLKLVRLAPEPPVLSFSVQVAHRCALLPPDPLRCFEAVCFPCHTGRGSMPPRQRTPESMRFGRSWTEIVAAFWLMMKSDICARSLMLLSMQGCSVGSWILTAKEASTSQAFVRISRLWRECAGRAWDGIAVWHSLHQGRIGCWTIGAASRGCLQWLFNQTARWFIKVEWEKELGCREQRH